MIQHTREVLSRTFTLNGLITRDVLHVILKEVEKDDDNDSSSDSSGSSDFDSDDETSDIYDSAVSVLERAMLLTATTMRL